MTEFKITIGTKEGITYQKEVKEQEAQPFIGLNIGETVKGDSFGLQGYEFLITGGSDYCGFPMRKGILGVRKKITSMGGVGFRHMKKGMLKRKTVCGHKISEDINQINLKVSKEGTKPLAELIPMPKKEKKGEEKKEGKKEAKEAKEQKAESKPEKKEVKEMKEQKVEAKNK